METGGSMTDYNLRIKLLRTLSAFMPLLEERELVIVDDKGIGQASSDNSLKVYDPNKTDIKQLYKTMKKPTKFAIEQPQNIQEGTTYFDKTDCTLKRYNGTNWEIIGQTIDFDNNLGGAWTKCINIPILTPPSEDIQYKIEINEDNILVYSNDGTTVLTSGNGGLDFWSNVQSDGKDIRVCDENYGQNYFWIETFDYTNKKARIWVKLNAKQEAVNIVYGNDKCLVSNYNDGSMTFEFFTNLRGQEYGEDAFITNIRVNPIKHIIHVRASPGSTEKGQFGLQVDDSHLIPIYVYPSSDGGVQTYNGTEFITIDANPVYPVLIGMLPFHSASAKRWVVGCESEKYVGRYLSTSGTAGDIKTGYSSSTNWTVRIWEIFVCKRLSYDLFFGTPTIIEL